MTVLQKLKTYSIDKDGDAFICQEALPEFESAVNTVLEIIYALESAKFSLDFYQERMEKLGRGKDRFFVDTQTLINAAIAKAKGE